MIMIIIIIIIMIITHAMFDIVPKNVDMEDCHQLIIMKIKSTMNIEM